MDEARRAELGGWAAVALLLTMAIAGAVLDEPEPDPWPIGTDWTFRE